MEATTLLRLQEDSPDSVEIIYEAVPISELSKKEDRAELQISIYQELEKIESQLVSNQDQLDELSVERERLTNQADNLDYAIAVASGVLTSLLDSFLGEELKKITDTAVNNKVIEGAKNEKIKESIRVAEERAKENGTTLSQGAKENIKKSVEKQFTANPSENGSISPEEEKRILSKAIRYLENHKKSPTDNVWKYTGSSITPESHHIDDLSHHASIAGLVASILTQFTKHGYFSNSSGQYLPISIDPNSGDLIGKTIPQKISCGFANWFWHLMSDVAGTSGKTAGAGMGIPGPVLSLAKELSMLPGLNRTALPEIVNSIFADSRMDFRSEVSQSIPVLLNDILIRIFYSVRRFIAEYRKKQKLTTIDWKTVVPFGNRTVARMITIATGTFTAVDIADAAIRAGAESGGVAPAFWSSFAIRVNIVGVGRFAVACGTDIRMGIRREKLINKEMHMQSVQMHLYNAKVFYKQADMWIAAESAGEAIEEMYKAAATAIQYAVKAMEETDVDIKRIGKISVTKPVVAREVLTMMEQFDL